VSISVVKCSWVKCSQVLQCSDVLLVLSCRFVYGCMFCILLFNSVIYVYLLTCMLSSVYSLLNWHSPVTLTEVFTVLSPQL
jgi:hypothetical protein